MLPGAVLDRVDLGMVSPLRALHVDAQAAIPDGASLIRLRILDADGADAGTLARASVSN